MKRIFTLIALLTIFACSASIAILSTAAETAVNRAADLAEAPPSAVDMVMRSRETAPETKDGSAWMIIGFLAVAVLIGGFVLLFLRFGGEFSRQGRLTLKVWQRPRASHAPQLEQMASTSWEDVPSVPAVRRPAALPYHDDVYSD